MKKKYIEKKIESCIDLSGSFDQVLQFLRDQEEELRKAGWTDLRLDEEGNYGSPTYAIYGKRLETDKEYQKRINKRKREEKKKQEEKQKKEEEEKRRLEELIKKYGVPKKIN